MKVGDLVLDIILGQMGIIVDLEWIDDVDEVVVVQLPDDTTVLCRYEDMELIACSNP